MRARFGDTERVPRWSSTRCWSRSIAVVCIGAVTLLGTSARNKFNEVGASIGQP